MLVYLLRWFVNEGLRRNRQGVYEKYTAIFLNTNHYNTLVIGSSRAEMHLDVSLLDSLTGLNSFNAGVSGGTTRMAYTVLKAYTLHSDMPRYVFLECDFHISHLPTDTIFNFPRYFPFLENPVLYEGFKAIDRRFVQFRYNPLYSLPYSGIDALSPALNGWMGRSGSYDTAYRKGFFINTVNDGYDHFNATVYNGQMHLETKQYLDSIIRFCQAHQSKLILTMSPIYSHQNDVMSKSRQQAIEPYKKLAAENLLPLFNYSADSAICANRGYFEDTYHLFYAGARLYTSKIASDFNNISR